MATKSKKKSKQTTDRAAIALERIATSSERLTEAVEQLTETVMSCVGEGGLARNSRVRVVLVQG